MKKKDEKKTTRIHANRIGTETTGTEMNVNSDSLCKTAGSVC